MSPPVELLIVFATGIVAAAVNTVAGSGSVITLTSLLLLGMPVDVANATNRIGVVVQGTAAISDYAREKSVTDLGKKKWRILLATLVGGGAGALAAIAMPREAIKVSLAVMLVAMLPTIWLTPDKNVRKVDGKARSLLAFFAVGFYGGLLQAGVGVLLLLCAQAFEGLEYVEGNAIKLIATTSFTAVAVAFFAASGLVDWPIAIALSIGQAIGGVIGSRMSRKDWVKKRLKWLNTLVVVAALTKLAAEALGA